MVITMLYSHTNTPAAATRHLLYDAVIIGGSVSGLASALTLGRASRRVLVIDAGQPRNRNAAYMHTVLAHDHQPPRLYIEQARDNMKRYDNVEMVSGYVEKVIALNKANGSASTSVSDGPSQPAQAQDGHFIVQWTPSSTINQAQQQPATMQASARKLILGTGVSDSLASLTHFSTLWGTHIFQCPYCHGYELKGGKWGVLLHNTMPPALAGGFIFHWLQQLQSFTPTQPLTILTNSGDHMTADQPNPLLKVLSEEQIKDVARHGIEVIHERIVDIIVVGEDGDKAEQESMLSIHFASGRTLAVTALFTVPQTSQSPVVQQLANEHALVVNAGMNIIQVDPFGHTTMPHVYAVGDCASMRPSVVLAAASGAMAATQLNSELATEEWERNTISSSNDSSIPANS